MSTPHPSSVLYTSSFFAVALRRDQSGARKIRQVMHRDVLHRIVRVVYQVHHGAPAVRRAQVVGEHRSHVEQPYSHVTPSDQAVHVLPHIVEVFQLGLVQRDPARRRRWVLPSRRTVQQGAAGPRKVAQYLLLLRGQRVAFDVHRHGRALQRFGREARAGNGADRRVFHRDHVQDTAGKQPAFLRILDYRQLAVLAHRPPFGMCFEVCGQRGHLLPRAERPLFAPRQARGEIVVERHHPARARNLRLRDRL